MTHVVAEYSDERTDSFWGPPPAHNGREVIDVQQNVVVNGRYNKLPTPAGQTATPATQKKRK